MKHEEEYKYPGQLIQHLLEQNGWTKRVLSTVLGVDESTVNKLISGTKRMDANTALSLSEIFSVDANIFMRLQNTYDLALATIKRQSDKGLEKKARVFSSFPIQEMIKRGWINVDGIKDIDAITNELKRFFQVDSLDEVSHMSYAAKKTDKDKSASGIQLAWMQRVKSLAHSMVVPTFSIATCKKLIKDLEEYRVSAPALRSIADMIMRAGIRFVIVESLKGSKIDGVCLWLDENKPVIGMSLRFDRIDNFWFVLRHELEHVLRGHGKKSPAIDMGLMTSSEESSLSNVEESLANKAALEFCVPQDKLENFIERKYPYFYSRDIIGFARTINVHPGLVAGQLRHKLNAYNRFGDHIVKIRSIVTRGALVDGWGDVLAI